MAVTMPISEARAKFYVMRQRLSRENVIFVARHSRPVFACVDLEYWNTVNEFMEILADPSAVAELRQCINEILDDRLHSHEDVKRDLLTQESTIHKSPDVAASRVGATATRRGNHRTP